MIGSSDTVLTEDFCVLEGTHYFVRCVLLPPIRGAEAARFGYGVWSTVSPTNFQICLDHFEAGERSHLEPWFGWFSSHLKGYPDPLNLKCRLHPQDGRNRPLVELEPTDHPLAVEQREGITFDRLLELYALNGHDLRKALSD